eukprot:gene10382-11298_t
MTGVSLLRKEDKDDIYKVMDDESSVVKENEACNDYIEAYKIPSTDSGLTIAARKIAEIQEGSSYLLNLGDAEDRVEKVETEEVLASGNTVREGVEDLRNVKSRGSVSMRSTELFDMFSVSSFSLLPGSDIDSEKDYNDDDNDDLSLIFELLEVGDNRTPSSSPDRIHKIHSSRPFPSFDEDVGDASMSEIEEKSNSEEENDVLSPQESSFIMLIAENDDFPAQKIQRNFLEEVDDDGVIDGFL